MPTRREFLTQTAAASLAAAIPVPVAQAAGDLAAPKPPMNTHKVPPTAGPRIKVIRREETTLRLGGNGDNFHMSWAADDRQFVALCDGTGWFDKPKAIYNSRLFAITGGPHDATFQDVPGYPHLDPAPGAPRYYGFGTLALDGRIYQFLTHFRTAAKLIYSPDNGRTWRNQDGSTPVVWESRDRHSRKTMVFFEEDQNAFTLLSVLQMGRNYEHNRDGYVYVYAPNGYTDRTMNELVMFRVPKARILDRRAYEYFAGRLPDGGAKWTADIQARTVVHTFPRGWVGREPYSWQPSVTYNAPLGLYMMANWGWDYYGDSSSKPSYLGFWVSTHPWGPWTQIHEETAWMPANDPAARAYQPQIAPKWIAADGKSFWLVWTDYQVKDEVEARRLDEEYKQITTLADTMRLLLRASQNAPYYAFNTQRVDLVLT